MNQWIIIYRISLERIYLIEYFQGMVDAIEVQCVIIIFIRI